MNWSTLYSSRRTGDPERKDSNPDHVRTSFLRDYDRIIFSSGFRRLQNKTQVFPLPGAVFVHNRLTHSLEVASVGRSLGKAVGEEIAKKYSRQGEYFIDFYRHELQSVIAAACLAHDIGNPPFGHSGEDAIRSYFTQLDQDKRAILNQHLTLNQLKDFELFEGNSNAFRILTHSFNETEAGGYKLTYATLASIVKYPCSSSEGFNKETGLMATKKSGFFDSEMTTYKEIASNLSIPAKEGYSNVYARHPFVYLTEAADDICYTIIDFEDGINLGLIEEEYALEYLINLVRDSINTSKYHSLTTRADRVTYLRALAINTLITEAVQIFLNNEEAILAGEFHQALLDKSRYEAQITDILDISIRNIYQSEEVLSKEIGGYQMLSQLLDTYTQALLPPAGVPESNFNRLILKLSPIGLREDATVYEKLIGICSYISSFTDRDIVASFKKFKGLEI